MFRRLWRDLSPVNTMLSIVRDLPYSLAGKLNIKMPIKGLCFAAYGETFLR
jgi:hypothetical protein